MFAWHCHKNAPGEREVRNFLGGGGSITLKSETWGCKNSGPLFEACQSSTMIGGRYLAVMNKTSTLRPAANAIKTLYGETNRRSLLVGVAAAGIAYAATGRALAQHAASDGPRAGLDKDELERSRLEAESIIQRIVGDRPLREGLVHATVPDIAEDGSAVPVSFAIESAMTEGDYPKTVHIVGTLNPFPELARFHFTPACGAAEVTFRCRMRTSSNLVIIADMADGSVGQWSQWVTVTVGACA